MIRKKKIIKGAGHSYLYLLLHVEYVKLFISIDVHELEAVAALIAERPAS
jgi:hypothetical protein